jgi:predicted nucleic acid-binding protein
MLRLVVDTNLYIDWLNAGRHEAVLFQRDAVKYLSAVVMMELYAGAFSTHDRRLLRQVTTAFRKAGRILLPSAGVYEEAGGVLRALRGRGYNPASPSSLVNDVLIALSARTIGAVVYSQNERDFAAIQSVRPFKLAVIT